MNRLYPPPKWQIAFKHMSRCSILLIKRKKIPPRYSFILLDWQKFQNLITHSVGKKNHTFLYIAVGVQSIINPMTVHLTTKLHMCFPTKPDISFLGIYSTTIPLQIPNSIFTRLFVIALYMISKDWRISKIQSTGNLLNKWWSSTQWRAIWL